MLSVTLGCLLLTTLAGPVATRAQASGDGRARDAGALTEQARRKLAAGDKVGAQELLVQALNADRNSIPANRMAGRLLLEATQYPQAMDRFETILALLPHDSEARQMELDAATRLAAQAQAAGNQEAALQVLEHAHDRMPDHAGLLLELGMLAFDLHRLREAEESLTTARRLDPENPDITYGLARVEIEQQHMPAAEADLRRYLKLRPNDASAHFGMGHIYAMEQRDDDAHAEFERSIQLQPVQTESYYQLGQLELNAQHDNLASPLFRKALARDPRHGGALAGLGQIALHAKQYNEAEAYLARAVQAAPEYAPAHYYHGLVLARLGRKTEADEELRMAAQLGHAAAANVQDEAAPR